MFYWYAQLLATLTLQPSHSHVTSLWLLLERDPQVSSVIAQCIAGTKTLRDLKLRFGDTGFGDVAHEARRELMRALSVNEGVHGLEVDGSWSEEADTRLLVDTVHSSRTLCHVSFHPNKCESATSLVRKLSPKIAGN
ncbi:hypothetical protein MTO96_043134 [Rhipicephalus appendiculatus]